MLIFEGLNNDVVFKLPPKEEMHDNDIASLYSDTQITLAYDYNNNVNSDFRKQFNILLQLYKNFNTKIFNKSYARKIDLFRDRFFKREKGTHFSIIDKLTLGNLKRKLEIILLKSQTLSKKGGLPFNTESQIVNSLIPLYSTIFLISCTTASTLRWRKGPSSIRPLQ